MKGYCSECKQFVEGQKTKNGGLLLLFIFFVSSTILFGVFGIVLSFLILIVYLVADIFNFENKCPICGLKIVKRNVF